MSGSSCATEQWRPHCCIPGVRVIEQVTHQRHSPQVMEGVDVLQETEGQVQAQSYTLWKLVTLPANSCQTLTVVDLDSSVTASTKARRSAV